MNTHGLSSNISHSTACFCVIYLPHFHLLFVILPVHLQKLLMSPTGTLIPLSAFVPDASGSLVPLATSQENTQ